MHYVFDGSLAYDNGGAGDCCLSVDYVVPGTSPWCTCFTIVSGYEGGEGGKTLFPHPSSPFLFSCRMGG